MPTEIVTTDDLREFKLELLKEIKLLFAAHHGQPTKKMVKILRSKKAFGNLSGYASEHANQRDTGFYQNWRCDLL